MSDKMATYKISHMDSLGQGVSKEADQITFISKTLPEEMVEARIYSQKKGVQFAVLSKVLEPSAKRILPSCSHFNDCPSCHFLHTDYESEFQFKLDSLERMFRKIPHPPIIGTKAIRRDQYRNRIQLHYNKDLGVIGLLDVKNHRIAPIPLCKIGTLSIQKKLAELYQNNAWLQLIPRDQPQKGHVEIYEQEQAAHLSWNRPYAEGGFSQVFEEMNQSLKDIMWSHYERQHFSGLLDLFGGNGNLSSGFNYSKRLCVDIYPHSGDPAFFNSNLYKDGALKEVISQLKKLALKVDFLLIDPPRSGFKELETWVNQFKPKNFAYVSCDPHTLVRDLEKLSNYKITELHLVDFFPSTFHFETMVFLEEK